MNGDKFHLILTIALAGIVGFGAAHILGSADAIAYPTGSAVSYGSNPVMAMGGGDGSQIAFSTTLATAPTDQRIIISDVIISTGWPALNQDCMSGVKIETSGGDVLASFTLVGVQEMTAGYATQPSSISHAFSSGLPVPVGEDLIVSHASIDSTFRLCAIAYTLSGYYAEP